MRPKLIRLGGLVPWRTDQNPSEPSLHAPYMAAVADPRCGDDPAIPNNKKNNGPVTLRVRAEAAGPCGCSGGPGT
jgi:hypothetical protein